jgi:hypothetical protein
MSGCNGFKIRGQNQDSNRVSIQSNVQTTWMLTYRRPGAAGPIWHEVGMLRDELIVIKCQGGEAVIEIEPLGDAAGTLIAQSSRKSTQTLRCGSRYRWELERGESLVMRCTNIVYPISAGAGLAV